MLKFKLYLNLVLSIMLVVGSLPALALSPTTSALVQKNYLANGGFENGPVGFKTYKNAAQATPVTGLGGTPATTMTTTTLTPIADKTSALYTHTAANLQGEGVALPFTLEPRAKAKMLTISGAYQIVSGVYSGGTSTTDSDVEVYVYDVDAGQLIQPAAYKLDGGVIGQMYSISATFQSSLTSTNYRLIFHSATTTTSAFQLKLDDFSVGSQSKTFGTTRGPVGSIISSASGATPIGYFPANGALVSRTTYSALFLAIGTTYGAGDGSTTFALPNLNGVFARGAGSQTIGGVTYSGTLGATSGDAMQGHVHNVNMYNGGASNPSTTNNTTPQSAYAPATSTGNGGSSVYSGIPGVMSPASDGTNGTPRTGSETRPANVGVAYYICYDSGQTSAADSGEGRVVAAQVGFSGSTQVIPASATATLQYSGVINDTTGMFNSATYTATVSVPGYYRVSAFYRIVNAPTQADKYLILNAGGASTNLDIVTTPGYVVAKGSTTVKLNAGQTIFMQASNTDASNPVSIQGGVGALSIERLSANSQILAGESVNARLSNQSAQSIPSGTTTSVTGWTKQYDSHSAFNAATGAYTCPVSGKYLVTGNFMYASASITANTQYEFDIFQTGSQTKVLTNATFPTAAGNTFLSLPVSLQIDCIAGDILQTQTYQNSGGARALYTGGSQFMHLEFAKVGN